MPTGLTAEKLRGHMVDAIVRAQPTSARVAEAMLAVPRHAFLPGAPVERAYADEAVITKRSSGGAALSCASVPSLVAAMLDQLDVQPGQSWRSALAPVTTRPCWPGWPAQAGT
jgi:protein-L-isoaspartate(D-aspartate) O-methyltransferase